MGLKHLFEELSQFPHRCRHPLVCMSREPIKAEHAVEFRLQHCCHLFLRRRIVTMPDTREARLRHLENGSLGLLISSPAISAYLSAERNGDLCRTGDESTKAGDSLRSCGACGTKMIIGWSCRVLKDPFRPGIGHTRDDPRKALTYERRLTCSTCGAVTIVQTDKPLQQAQKGSNTTSDAASNFTENGTFSATLKPRTSDSKPSTRRGRTKKSTLQSLLTDQKEAYLKRSQGFGMDFTDLMQT